MAARDDVIQALDDLRAAMVKEMTARAGSLPRIRRVRIPAPAPALALAYDLYEDAAREGDIARRNAARHPGFMPADDPIEALSE